jgi:hypothetical protein
MLNAPAQRPSQTAIRKVGTLPVTSFAGGASVKVAQTRLGHGSAVVTLNTYGHLWPGDDDLTRTVMDSAFAILADSLRTSAAAEG